MTQMTELLQRLCHWEMEVHPAILLSSDVISGSPRGTTLKIPFYIDDVMACG